MTSKKSKVTALDVAKLLLKWANNDGDLITNLRMQKLLYYAQAWYLVNYKKPLFEDEIQAWALGPVVPNVYGKFKKFGHAPIVYESQKNEEEVFTDKQLRYLKVFYDRFSNFSAHILVSMTHNEEPWKDNYDETDPKHCRVIDHNIMKSYYSKQYEKKQKSTH